LLTFKGKQQTSNTTEDIARPEYETRISNADTLINLLLTSGYETLVIIDKIRQSYTYNAMEINIDEIKGLGSFIEVELLVAQENDIDDAKKQIIAFFQTLAIDKSHIIHKGYVPLCLEAGIK
jgi:adenylate cyclase class 2